MVLLKDIILLIAAIFTCGLAAVRLIESINELRKTPELSTLGKVIQVIKNFFTIEKYAPVEKTETSSE